MVGCPESVSKAAEFFEDAQYSDAFDGRCRDAIKSKHEVADFFAYTSVKRRLDEIETLLRQEAEPSSSAAQTTTTATIGCSGQAANAEPKRRAAASAAEAEGYDKLGADEQDRWRQHVLKLIKSHIRLIPADNKSVTELEAALKDCPFALLRGDPSGLVLLHFDTKKYGEPTTRPDLRVPTLRAAWYNKLVKAILAARRPSSEAPSNLSPGEVAVVLDGGRRGLKTKLLGPWRDGTSKDPAQGKKEKANAEDEGGDDDEDDGGEEEEGETGEKPGFFVDVLQLAYTEESLKARRLRARGKCTLKQIECCLCMSANKLSLPNRERRHFPGTSNGDVLLGVKKPELEKEWHLTWGQTKMYGRKHLIEVGGKTQDADGASLGLMQQWSL